MLFWQITAVLQIRVVKIYLPYFDPYDPEKGNRSREIQGRVEQWSKEKTMLLPAVFDCVVLKWGKVCRVGFLWNHSSFLRTFKPSPT